MTQRFRLTRPVKHLALFLFITFSTAALAVPRVAVSIAPIHSIAANIMTGVGEPDLILEQGMSPHHASLRPSQRRLIADADVIFWVSPSLEGFMPRLLLSSPQAQQNIILIDTPGMALLSARHHHESESYDHRAEHDTHIWLSPENTRLIARTIASALAQIDPANAARYRANLADTLARIDALDGRIRARLAGIAVPYVTYHDAYQYFEHSYDLNFAGSITSISDARPGTRHVRDVRSMVEERGIRCLFYDAPKAPALVGMLQSGTQLQAVELDPLGIRQPVGPSAWFRLMETLSESISDCLTAR